MPDSRRTFLYMMKSFAVLILFHQMDHVSGGCTHDIASFRQETGNAMRLKFVSIGLLLVAGALGVSLPLIGKKIPVLRPENDIFFMVKAFAAGVILCTGFVHILPDAFETLNSPCLGSVQNFPFAGFVAMLSAMGTLMMDTLATGYYERRYIGKKKTKEVSAEEEEGIGRDEEEHGIHIQAVHSSHATHGHAHGLAASPPPAAELPPTELIRRRIISQVLEVGIVVHSVIIGISLGTSESTETIKPLLVALSFHQFFEGLGLGGCISQAQLKSRKTVIMATFFSLTAPVGIGMGMGISKGYEEESREGLIVEGVFNAASGGILIYMALVDLLAADFMNPRLQSNLRLQLGANLSLLLGAASMSVLANWA